MKFRIFFLGLATMALVAVTYAPTSSALGLKAAPLEYKTTLKKNERQVGIIDVSNPMGQTVHVRTSVQAFRQIDNNGGLQFYDDERTASGIKTDLGQFDLGPREALRMSFTIDGAKLPEGDVFAAIFFTTDLAVPRSGVGQLVRVGTILSIVNKTPGSRAAEITGFNAAFLQLSDTTRGTYKVKNTGPTNGGFYPVVKVSAWPVGKTKDVQSSLVFGGRERQNDFQYPSGYGIHLIEVGYGNSKKSQWVVTIAPWMLIATIMIILIIGIEILLYKRRHKFARQKTDSTS
jgi:hypothetical protein